MQKSELRCSDNFWDQLKVMTIQQEQTLQLILYLFRIAPRFDKQARSETVLGS